MASARLGKMMVSYDFKLSVNIHSMLDNRRHWISKNHFSLNSSSPHYFSGNHIAGTYGRREARRSFRYRMHESVN